MHFDGGEASEMVFIQACQACVDGSSVISGRNCADECLLQDIDCGNNGATNNETSFLPHLSGLLVTFLSLGLDAADIVYFSRFEARFSVQNCLLFMPTKKYIAKSTRSTCRLPTLEEICSVTENDDQATQLVNTR